MKSNKVPDDVNINDVSEAEWYMYFTVFIIVWMVMIMVMT